LDRRGKSKRLENWGDWHKPARFVGVLHRRGIAGSGGPGKTDSSFGRTDPGQEEVVFSAHERSDISPINEPSGTPLDPPSEQGRNPVMEHAQEPPEATGPSAHGPHLRLRTDETPADFAPLRLFLEPSGTVIEVNRPDMIIGRHTGADIRLPLPDVSRRHCRLQFTEGRWHVVDLNSLNGTQINGEHVLRASLEQGDLLRIGGFTFTVDLHGRSRKTGSSGHVQSILKTLSIRPQSKAS
jgi:hypothetical protein